MAVVRYGDVVWRGALARKMRGLAAWIDAQSGILTGFSGGVDSTFLATLAAQTKGKGALAVTIDSPFLARSELREARRLARLIAEAFQNSREAVGVLGIGLRQRQPWQQKQKRHRTEAKRTQEVSKGRPFAAR